MQIEKVYNNNVVQVIDSKGQELIVMGKGLGFQRKAGEELSTEKIEKTFILQNEHQTQDLSELYLNMETAELEVVNAILSKAEEDLRIEFDLALYVALGDHLHFIFQRSREGISLENPLSWEIRKFYPKEYQIGLSALGIIEEKLGLNVEKGEASSIALHLINAQKNGVFGKETQTISKIVTQILDIVRLHFGWASYDEDNTSYHRFVTHIQYFAQRVANGVIEGQNDAFLYEQVKANYPDSFACTTKIRQHIAEVYQFDMSKDEQVYLTIHIQRLKTLKN
ncbi:transcription antiterminator BglG [Streptococcus azizii]|uniref:Transcription antiterminator BglG n=1 Tax=Streptococcus azizii TaxID=1579424 RepID=A0AB36JNM4_9STRE|nr:MULTISPECIES: PRD domain-containing protein [Streptococcus]MBF0776831.1 PRD domain-containing protein [Streptococcus sp. 19428wD3_AN2]ONK25570.1 transcription antiterminator BglG [Streptococcus azizii]ONK25929.1 transcription antiterminator BglG [Streptococcus azizii]ONK26227.1 transcription antiterminator BglG [Streptococcus azizii]TFU82291.1 PRD domain-containing protein [Streptococcus sp. AN2]